VREPSPERQRAIVLMLTEVALSSSARNGRALPDDVAWLLTRLALNAPGTAARLPRVMAGLSPEVRAAVTRLAGQTSHAARSDVPPGAPASVEWAGSPGRDGRAAGAAPAQVLSVRQAAASLRISSHAVRAAARRGSLKAVKDAGRWTFTAAAVDAYQQRRRSS